MLIRASRWIMESRKNSSKIIKKGIACRQPEMRVEAVTAKIKKHLVNPGVSL